MNGRLIVKRAWQTLGVTVLIYLAVFLLLWRLHG
jgi:cytochrome c1